MVVPSDRAQEVCRVAGATVQVAVVVRVGVDDGPVTTVAAGAVVSHWTLCAPGTVAVPVSVLPARSVTVTLRP